MCHIYVVMVGDKPGYVAWYIPDLLGTSIHKDVTDSDLSKVTFTQAGLR